MFYNYNILRKLVNPKDIKKTLVCLIWWSNKSKWTNMNESSFGGSSGFLQTRSFHVTPHRTFFHQWLRFTKVETFWSRSFTVNTHLKFFYRVPNVFRTMKNPGFVGSNVGVYKSVYTKVISEKDFGVCRDTRCRVYLRSSCPDSKVDMRQGASVKGTAPQEEWHDCCSHTSSLLPFFSLWWLIPPRDGEWGRGGKRESVRGDTRGKKHFMFQSLPEPIEYITQEVICRHLFPPVPQGVSKKDCIPLFFPSCLHCRSWAISSPNHLSNMLSCVSVCPLVHCCAHLMISAGEIPLFQGIPGLYLWASPT